MMGILTAVIARPLIFAVLAYLYWFQDAAPGDCGAA